MHHYRWFAVYTHENEEHVMLEYLMEQGFHAYLPERRYWNILGVKRNIAYEPLFRSHVFVWTTVGELARVKRASSYSHMVRFGRHLAAIPESHIIKIKMILNHYEEVTSVPMSSVKGVPVSIVAGPLLGLLGLLDNGEGQRPVAIEIAQLEHAILVNVPMATVVRTEVASPVY